MANTDNLTKPALLQQAGAYLHYDEADFEQDLLIMEKLMTQETPEKNK